MQEVICTEFKFITTSLQVFTLELNWDWNEFCYPYWAAQKKILCDNRKNDCLWDRKHKIWDASVTKRFFKSQLKSTNTFLDYGAQNFLASEYSWCESEKMHLISKMLLHSSFPEKQEQELDHILWNDRIFQELLSHQNLHLQTRIITWR